MQCRQSNSERSPPIDCIQMLRDELADVRRRKTRDQTSADVIGLAIGLLGGRLRAALLHNQAPGRDVDIVLDAAAVRLEHGPIHSGVVVGGHAAAVVDGFLCKQANILQSDTFYASRQISCRQAPIISPTRLQHASGWVYIDWSPIKAASGEHLYCQEQEQAVAKAFLSAFMLGLSSCCMPACYTIPCLVTVQG